MALITSSISLILLPISILLITFLHDTDSVLTTLGYKSTKPTNHSYINKEDISITTSNQLSEETGFAFNFGSPCTSHQNDYEISNNRTNATLYTLCRNSDLYSMLETIQIYEDRFNSKYHYDWVFLNNEPFTENFQKLVSNSVSGIAKFGLIPEDHWSFPDDLDIDHMNNKIDQMLNDEEGVLPYAGSISYRHMCRFESGFFYKHPLLLNYDYFWRVEPGVKLFCDINYDLFTHMATHDYKYGFVISTIEYPKTIPSLFKTLESYLTENDQLDLLDTSTNSSNYARFIYDKDKNDYNLCHFWTNFEIGNLNTLRSDKYNEIFNYLDKQNGFFYERWGDAPIRSLILSLILSKGEIKRFNDIGYLHEPYLQCPIDEKTRLQQRCSCDPNEDFTDLWFSCSWYFDQIQDAIMKDLELEQN